MNIQGYLNLIYRKMWIKIFLFLAFGLMLLGIVKFIQRNHEIKEKTNLLIQEVIASPGMFNDGAEIDQRLKVLGRYKGIENILIFSSDWSTLLASYPDVALIKSIECRGYEKLSVELSGLKVANACIKYNFNFILYDLIEVSIYFILFSGIVLMLGLFMIRKISSQVSHVFYQFVESLNDKNKVTEIDTKNIHEVSQLKEALIHFYHLEEQFNKEKDKWLKAEAYKEVAEQVTHDIRAPLDFLNKSVDGLKDSDTVVNIKKSLKRINEIADQLLNDSKVNIGNEIRLAYLNDLLINLIEEKQLTKGNYFNLQINANAFVFINYSHLYRILSNLINNSCESMDKLSGRIAIEVSVNDEWTRIVVSDNGKGIPEEILSQIGSKGFSYGKSSKESGNGFGLYFAKKYINECGGSLEIESVKDVGTKVILNLKIAKSPNWFSLVEDITKYKALYYFGEDRFFRIIAEGWPNLNRLSSLDKEIFSLQNVDLSNSLFFFDISHLDNLNQIPDFLTSNVYFISENINYLINKTFLNDFKFNILSINQFHDRLKMKDSLNNRQHYDVVLIDDDQLVRLLWEAECNRKGKKIIIFSSYAEFLRESNSIAFNSTIYFDSNLGGGVRGEEVSLEAYNMGFINIIICTGHTADKFINLKHIKKVIGKMPDF